MSPLLSPIDKLIHIVSTLRDPKIGCPWDLKQTFASIIPHTVEETYELVDAIHKKDWPNMREELGDVLLQVVLLTQISGEHKSGMIDTGIQELQQSEAFDFNDVVTTLCEKLIRRHPHVFTKEGEPLTHKTHPGDQSVLPNPELSYEENALAIWNQAKAQEKQKAGKVEASVLDRIPTSIPALSKAYKIQKQCAKYGFDWDELEPVVAKVHEEIDEVLEEVKTLNNSHIQAVDAQTKVEEELGDLLFATVNMVRHLGCDPETALAKANQKFERRFKGVEQKVAEQGKVLTDCDLEELDQYWDAIKGEEKG